MTTFRLIGAGRAGRSIHQALEATGRYRCVGILGRDDDLADAAQGVDLLIIATPDQAVGEVARAVTPVTSTTVLHLSGSLGLGVLIPHPRRASVHPLVPLPNAEVGALRLASGISFAVAGDSMARRVVEDLAGRAFAVADGDRDRYHAAAAIAANHLVALLGQVERVAATVGLPLDAFAGLVRAATDDAMALGPRQALTGPAMRGDWDTVERHRRELRTMAGSRTELSGYDAMVAMARRLSLEEAESVPTGPGVPSVSDVDLGRDLLEALWDVEVDVAGPEFQVPALAAVEDVA
jgi:predicted short-subunit dehydrogenase-like oxidoreductase (DUF2520 family)